MSDQKSREKNTETEQSRKLGPKKHDKILVAHTPSRSPKVSISKMEVCVQASPSFANSINYTSSGWSMPRPISFFLVPCAAANEGRDRNKTKLDSHRDLPRHPGKCINKSNQQNPATQEKDQMIPLSEQRVKMTPR